MRYKLTGFVAATFTPMHTDGSLDLAKAKPIVDFLVQSGISGLYVCGTTGEGPLLTTEERKLTAAAFIEAASGRLPVVVQVGHSSVVEARQLAAHAQQAGADAISAVSPYYVKPSSVESLGDCLREIAGGAPKLPFYYYHIPLLSGVSLDPVELLHYAARNIPTFAGIKYTAPIIDELQTLLAAENGSFDILFGRDEMLLSGLVAGAHGMVGSTYNFAMPLYRQLLTAFQQNDIDKARRCQAKIVAMVRTVIGHRFQAGLKAAMGLFGVECGPNRLPAVSLSPQERVKMREELESQGFTTTPEGLSASDI